jgi:hypothetical protein
MSGNITKGIIALLSITLIGLTIGLFSSVQDAKNNVLNNGLTTTATPLDVKRTTGVMPMAEGGLVTYNVYTVTFSYSVDGKVYKISSNSSTEKEAERQMNESYIVKYLEEDPSKAVVAKAP